MTLTAHTTALRGPKFCTALEAAAIRLDRKVALWVWSTGVTVVGLYNNRSVKWDELGLQCRPCTGYHYLSEEEGLRILVMASLDPGMDMAAYVRELITEGLNHD